MKKYIQPNIKVQQLEAEPLMAAVSEGLGTNDKVSGSDQLAKPNIDEEPADEKTGSFSSVWDED